VGAIVSTMWMVYLFLLIPLHEITASDQAMIITCIQLRHMSQSSIFRYQQCQPGIQLSKNQLSIKVQVLPEVICEEPVTTPHSRE